MLVALPHIATADDQGSDDGTHHPTDHETLVTFHIRLTGDQQSPPVTTTAFGFAEVRLFQNGTSSAIEFRVIVCNITNVTHSHIHVGAIGTTGNTYVNVHTIANPLGEIRGQLVHEQDDENEQFESSDY